MVDYKNIPGENSIDRIQRLQKDQEADTLSLIRAYREMKNERDMWKKIAVFLMTVISLGFVGILLMI